MKTTHPACGKSWTSARAQHCPLCCETFTGTEPADRHRRGSFGGKRYCARPETVGLTLTPAGLWQRSRPDRQPFERKH
ncbi:FDXHR family putative zinc-binding protein [Streptomyces sp. NPDC001571]